MTDPDADLRARLAAIDPMAPSAVPEPLERGRARQILEAAMTTTDNRTTAPPPKRRLILVAAAAAAVLAIGGGVALLTAGDDADPVAGGGPGPTTLELSLPAPDVSASCVQFAVEFLADMPTAFAGTVTDLSDEAITFDVDRWYAGGAADVVTVAKVDGNTSAALDSIEFESGQRYLVTASEVGTVNGCGFSGPATPDYEASFDEAFPG